MVMLYISCQNQISRDVTALLHSRFAVQYLALIMQPIHCCVYLYVYLHYLLFLLFFVLCFFSICHFGLLERFHIVHTKDT